MTSAKRDFEDFIKWIHLPESQTPSDVRRLANLVLTNFDAVASTSRSLSRRSVLLAGLAQQQLPQTPDTPPVLDSVSAAITWPWRRLQELKVGPFRGFRYPEQFDLKNRLVMFYGPNGSGKTSLCEALEYALLGSVGEAEAKRITEANYLPNIHERKFDSPVLKALGDDGNEMVVTPNDMAYRFCFIEKNRIDSFSRLAAKPPAQRSELIATLFGMEQFNEFVGQFNESIENQLMLANTKQMLLLAKRSTLLQDQAIVENEAMTNQAMEAEEQALAVSYGEGTTYESLKAQIGTGDAASRLKHLTSLLDTISPVVLNVTRDGVQELYSAAQAAHKQLQALTEELTTKAEQVSFKELYSAVIALQATSSGRCPACDTPLSGPSKVVTNPFEKAAIGLDQLGDLAVLQAKLKGARAVAAQVGSDLSAKLNALRQFLVASAELNTRAGQYLDSLPDPVTPGWWNSTCETTPESGLELSTLEAVFDVAQRVESQDSNSRAALEQRQSYITERDRLIQYQLLVQAQDSKRQLFVESVISARERISSFDEENAELIKAAALEIADNQRDMPIKEAYDKFLKLLRHYLSKLPGTLIAGLNEQAMLLYNDFNRDDRDADKLAALHLPLTADERIEVSFCGNPHRKVDALKILSEGHVRCLGLAILLAKNLHLGSPLIVFDDAINAIDTEHRRGIRETIFQNGRFVDTQIIVTCHSNEFIKDIQQSLTPAARDNSKLYLFLNHDGNYHPKVKRNVPSRNYIDMARAARDEGNDRGALDASRKALEVITERIWRWLGKNGHGNIRVPLAGVGAEPVLRNLCEALRARMVEVSTFAHVDKAAAVAAMDRVLGVPEGNLVWLYLNKGTHEESNRDDFDGSVVESVVQTLEELEKLALC